MALRDYQKLCPRSGRALSDDERRALAASGKETVAVRSIRCEACGRIVDVCPDPGTGRSLLYSMHLKAEAVANGDCGTGVR